MSIKVRDLIRELRPVRVEFSSGKHRFWFRDERSYNKALDAAVRELHRARSEALRGYARGVSIEGSLFVDFMLH